MRRAHARGFLGLLLALFGTALPLAAYVLLSPLWPTPPSGATVVTMQLQLDTPAPAAPLSDGSATWGQVAAQALAEWNATMLRLQFASIPNSNAPLGRPNGFNNVFFSNTIYGDSWGSGVIAVAIIYAQSGPVTPRRVEADVLFNSNRSWNSYRGPLGPAIDFKRVALHEFGHVVGLDHPDQAGQSVTAVMNSIVGNVDGLTADDIAGAAFAYGAGTPITPPTIQGVSFPATVSVGATATFTVSASGSAPLSYQWRKNTTAIGGATSASYSIANAQLADSGSYTVTVTNSGGSATSAPAVLTVQPVAPSIVVPPQSQTVAAGGTATFTVGVAGTPPFTYQWQRGTTPISGATAAMLVLTNVQGADAGSYSVSVGNASGSVTSAAATLAVTFPPTLPSIVTQPTSQTAIMGQPVTFSVVGQSPTPIAYQWRRNGIPIPGATGASLSLSIVGPGDAGDYSVDLTNVNGTVSSALATLTVIAATVPPSIVQSPAGRLVVPGETVTFTVVASGSAPLTFSWKRNGSPVSGAVGPILTLRNVQSADAGDYTVTVSNAGGSATSTVATLVVQVPAVAPAITAAPSSRTVLEGEEAVFSVTATGTAPLSYQWMRNQVAIPGAIAPVLRIGAATLADAGNYAVTVSNTAGSVTSAAVALAVTPRETAPMIVGQPGDLTVRAGDRVELTLVATGTAPLRYEWRQAGVPIRGAETATLVIPSAQLPDGGTYTATVSNALGSASTRPATLTILPPEVPPTIVTPPAGRVVTAGASVSLSVFAVGTAPLAYAWRRDGAIVAGATTDTLAFIAVREVDAGAYTVTVTNAFGSVTSAPALLDVRPAGVAPTILAGPADAVVAAGGRLALAVTAAGTAPLAYQWIRDGLDLAAQTTAMLVRDPASPADAGEYRVRVSNAFGTVTSGPARVAVALPPSGRITNVSIRTTLAAEEPLIVGLTMEGGSKPVLVRAVGPGLVPFGVAGAMPDPRVALFAGAEPVAQNDDWGGGADLSAAFAAVGAFGLPPGSRDAALLGPVNGGRTAQVRGSPGGTVLVEAYDAGEGNRPRLVNVSARNRVANDADRVIAGFTIAGDAPRTVLVRAVGPTLAAFGVVGALGDPRIEVFSGTTRVAANDDWSAELQATFDAVGAFRLTAGSRDAALRLTLLAGGYTVQVTGAPGQVGDVLVELYEAP